MSEDTPATYGNLSRPNMVPPKFASVAEAEAWMEQNEPRARGAMDRVLRPKGT